MTAIPEEAIDAGLYAWGFSAQNVDERRELLQRILEAAAPHIGAQALEEAAYAFEGLPMNKGASISSGTYDWFELFPIQHIRDRAEDLRG